MRSSPAEAAPGSANAHDRGAERKGRVAKRHEPLVLRPAIVGVPAKTFELDLDSKVTPRQPAKMSIDPMVIVTSQLDVITGASPPIFVRRDATIVIPKK